MRAITTQFCVYFFGLSCIYCAVGASWHTITVSHCRQFADSLSDFANWVPWDCFFNPRDSQHLPPPLQLSSEVSCTFVTGDTQKRVLMMLNLACEFQNSIFALNWCVNIAEMFIFHSFGPTIDNYSFFLFSLYWYITPVLKRFISYYCYIIFLALICPHCLPSYGFFSPYNGVFYPSPWISSIMLGRLFISWPLVMNSWQPRQRLPATPSISLFLS